MAQKYIGELSPTQIDQGILACAEHAKRLKRILTEIASVERGLAFSLACIRVEELSKVLLLIEMGSGKHDSDAWKRFWRRFRDHREKWEEYGYSRFKDVPDEQPAKELGKGFSSWAGAKNFGLYVDFANGIGFRSPSIFPRIPPPDGAENGR